jgi:hypothetical protein
MDFGDIVPKPHRRSGGDDAGAAAMCTTTGGLVRTASASPPSSPGSRSSTPTCACSGRAGNRIDLTGPGGVTMRLDAFTFGSTGPTAYLGSERCQPPLSRQRRDGSFLFYVGGTLHVKPNQAPGRLQRHVPDSRRLQLTRRGGRGPLPAAGTALKRCRRWQTFPNSPWSRPPACGATAPARSAAAQATGPAALGHPRVYLQIDENGYVDCGYCDRRFVLRGGPAEARTSRAARHSSGASL